MEFGVHDDEQEDQEESDIEDPSADGGPQSEGQDTSTTGEPPEPDGDGDSDDESGGISPDLSEAAEAAQKAFAGGESESADEGDETDEEDSNLLLWVIIVGMGVLALGGEDTGEMLNDLFGDDGGGNNGPGIL